MSILFGKNAIRKNRLAALQEAYDTLNVQTAPVLREFEAGTATGPDLRRWGEQVFSVRMMYFDDLVRRELHEDPEIRSVLDEMNALQLELLRRASYIEESYRERYMARARERVSLADELDREVAELVSSGRVEPKDLRPYFVDLERLFNDHQDEAPFVPALIEHKAHTLMLLRYLRDRVWDLMDNGGNGLNQINKQFEQESQIRNQRLREASSTIKGFTSII